MSSVWAHRTDQCTLDTALCNVWYTDLASGGSATVRSVRYAPDSVFSMSGDHRKLIVPCSVCHNRFLKKLSRPSPCPGSFHSLVCFVSLPEIASATALYSSPTTTTVRPYSGDPISASAPPSFSGDICNAYSPSSLSVFLSKEEHSHPCAIL